MVRHDCCNSVPVIARINVTGHIRRFVDSQSSSDSSSSSLRESSIFWIRNDTFSVLDKKGQFSAILFVVFYGSEYFFSL